MASKYGNTKCYADGFKFDSKMECDYYYFLKIAKDQNKIKDFTIHPTFELQPRFTLKGKTISHITYTPDFVVEYNDGSLEAIDVKGTKTNEFKLKQKMFNFKYPEYNLKCVTLHKENWIEI